MSNILRLDSGAKHDASTTRLLADEVVAHLSGPSTNVVRRDLSIEVPSAVTNDWVIATRVSGAETGAQKAALAESDSLVDELVAADVVVISAPIYNFSFPASLKLWIDQIARAGRTFNYSEAGPEGLLSGKRAIVVVASGGVPIGSPMDFATPYLKQVLGFVGIADVQFIVAERTAFDAAAAVSVARDQILALAV